MGDAPLTVILQPRCLLHRFIRSKDVSTAVERPERLRAVAVGIAAAASRLEEYQRRASRVDVKDEADDFLAVDSLTGALGRLAISPSSSGAGQLADPRATTPFNIVIASASTKLDILNNESVRFIHGEAHEYVEKLTAWASSSEDKIRAGESEIPAGYSQGDLYLCPQSIEAIAGSIAAVCEAVDITFDTSATMARITADSTPYGALEQDLISIAPSPTTKQGGMDATQVPLPQSPVQPAKSLASNSRRVFAAIRPPGHHCSDETPSGFCFVNNVMIAAAHAHLHYGVRRIIVLDFDLHHGNGTQSIAWSINAETQLQEEEAGLPPSKVGPKVYYGSLHDIMSYPCEDGDANIIQAASTTLSGAHGQYIENVHLEPYTSDEDFFSRLYPFYRGRLLGGAARFLEKTGEPSSSDKTMVFVSAGFDASPHEHSYMSRHNRNVPTAFYTMFARDVVEFAERYAQGRIVSVLEGGYSDWALMSASGAYLCGLAVPCDADDVIRQAWWESDDLELLQRLTRPAARGAKPRTSRSSSALEPSWFRRTREVTETLISRELFEPLAPVPTLRGMRSPANTNPSQAATVNKMTLRDRKKNRSVASTVSQSPPKPKQTRTPSYTPESSPPKSRQAPASRKKTVPPGPQAGTSSENSQNEKPNPAVVLTSRPPAKTKENDLTPPVLRLAKPPSDEYTTTNPIDSVVIDAPLTTESQPPLKIRIKLPPRVKSSEADVPVNISTLAPVTDPLPPS